MFYQKTIKKLRAEVADARRAYGQITDKYFENKQELDKVRTDVLDLESKNATLSFEVADAQIANNDLRQKNRELEYQNGLLASVLQQLRIPVKLPARKS